MNIKNVAVIGAGTMGSSIAVALISSGYEVTLVDVEQSYLDSGLQRIDKFLASKVKKGLSQADADKQKSLLKTSTDYANFLDIDLAIEAVVERIDVKTKVFQTLETSCRKDTIFATNTSSIAITRIAATTSCANRIIGMHFFNPAHLMNLVEIIPGLETSQNTIDSSMAFAKSLGKLAVKVEECTSFLVNRLLGRYMNESLWCLQDGAASAEEIDEAACKFVMPVGPLALRDMNGADIGLAVASLNHSEYGPRYETPPILQRMVDENMLGQKTGKGFYLYDPETRKRTAANPALQQFITRQPPSAANSFDVHRLFLPMINEALLALQEKICAAEDLDPALMAGLGMRKGPLALASEIGLSTCLEKTEKLFAQYGERFRPAPLLKRYVWAQKNPLCHNRRHPALAEMMGAEA